MFRKVLTDVTVSDFSLLPAASDLRMAIDRGLQIAVLLAICTTNPGNGLPAASNLRMAIDRGLQIAVLLAICTTNPGNGF